MQVPLDFSSNDTEDDEAFLFAQLGINKIDLQLRVEGDSSPCRRQTPEGSDSSDKSLVGIAPEESGVRNQAQDTGLVVIRQTLHSRGRQLGHIEPRGSPQARPRLNNHESNSAYTRPAHQAHFKRNNKVYIGVVVYVAHDQL